MGSTDTNIQFKQNKNKCMHKAALQIWQEWYKSKCILYVYIRQKREIRVRRREAGNEGLCMAQWWQRTLKSTMSLIHLTVTKHRYVIILTVDVLWLVFTFLCVSVFSDERVLSSYLLNIVIPQIFTFCLYRLIHTQ